MKEIEEIEAELRELEKEYATISRKEDMSREEVQGLLVRLQVEEKKSVLQEIKSNEIHLIILSQVLWRDEFVAEDVRLGYSVQTTRKYIDELASKGLFLKTRQGRRIYYVNNFWNFCTGNLNLSKEQAKDLVKELLFFLFFGDGEK